MKKNLLILLLMNFLSLTAFAAEQVAKEETTPPPAEGPLTIEQIPPINSMPLARKSSGDNSQKATLPDQNPPSEPETTSTP